MQQGMAPGMPGMSPDAGMPATSPAPGMPVTGMPATPDMTGMQGVPTTLDASAMAMGGMDPATYAAYMAQYQAAMAMQQQVYLAQIASLYAVPQLTVPGQDLSGLTDDGEGPEYLGQIVDYSEDKGWGFIECKETQLRFGKDIFLLRSSLQGSTVVTGDKVKFRVEQGDKGPKATSCDIVEKIADLAASMPQYWGKVKNFDEKRGLGFIECDETKSIYDKDILVLKTQLGEKPDGQVVSFNIVVDSRGIKAANVKAHPDGFPPGKEPKPKPKPMPMTMPMMGAVNPMVKGAVNPMVKGAMNPMLMMSQGKGAVNPMVMNQGKGMGMSMQDPWQKGKGWNPMFMGGGKGWAPY